MSAIPVGGNPNPLDRRLQSMNREPDPAIRAGLDVKVVNNIDILQKIQLGAPPIGPFQIHPGDPVHEVLVDTVLHLHAQGISTANATPLTSDLTTPTECIQTLEALTEMVTELNAAKAAAQAEVPPNQAKVRAIDHSLERLSGLVDKSFKPRAGSPGCPLTLPPRWPPTSTPENLLDRLAILKELATNGNWSGDNKVHREMATVAATATVGQIIEDFICNIDRAESGFQLEDIFRKGLMNHGYAHVSEIEALRDGMRSSIVLGEVPLATREREIREQKNRIVDALNKMQPPPKNIDALADVIINAIVARVKLQYEPFNEIKAEAEEAARRANPTATNEEIQAAGERAVKNEIERRANIIASEKGREEKGPSPVPAGGGARGRRPSPPPMGAAAHPHFRAGGLEPGVSLSPDRRIGHFTEQMLDISPEERDACVHGTSPTTLLNVGQLDPLALTVEDQATWNSADFERYLSDQVTKSGIDTGGYSGGAIAQAVRIAIGEMEISVDKKGTKLPIKDASTFPSMVKEMHRHGVATVCGPSGTTVDIMGALVARYGKDRAKEIMAPLYNLARGDNNLTTDNQEWKQIFRSITYFMQAGNYHSAAEVLAGMVIAAEALHTTPLRRGASAEEVSLQGLREVTHFAAALASLTEEVDKMMGVQFDDTDKATIMRIFWETIAFSSENPAVRTEAERRAKTDAFHILPPPFDKYK